MKQFFGTIVVIAILGICAGMFLNVLNANSDSLVGSVPAQNKEKVNLIIGLTSSENEKQPVSIKKPVCKSVEDGESISSIIKDMNDNGYSFGYDAVILLTQNGEPHRFTDRQALDSNLVIYPGDTVCVAYTSESFN
jgi:hypothetical protein